MKRVARSLRRCFRRGALVAVALAGSAACGLACEKAGFVVAVDVGHEIRRPGATSARGEIEYRYNRALAGLVVAGLQQAGYPRAFLIDGSGGPMPLGRRPAIAQQAHASLFLSIHHDSVQPQYLGTWTVEGRSERFSDRFHGFSIFVSTERPAAAASLRMARLLGQALRADGLTPSLHHAEPIAGESRRLLDPADGVYAFDELAVLRGATMPAVLLEAGVIVNRDEEAAIRSGSYHRRAVAGVVKAVGEFCHG